MIMVVGNGSGHCDSLTMVPMMIMEMEIATVVTTIIEVTSAMVP